MAVLIKQIIQKSLAKTGRNHTTIQYIVIEFKKKSHFAGIGKSLMIIKFLQ